MYCLGPYQPHQPELNIKLLTYLLTYSTYRGYYENVHG